ncbi:Aldolase-type TIM barrel [Vigna unguiculata]|uniref:Aldolase-type TIM barrel n=1 Tax=Vigna unguiculata TaxID=3917 RepID=A0A4D6M676_VIGUN|nr:Aldolase-type TIM barrel [Vigna unguiculata]
MSISLPPFLSYSTITITYIFQSFDLPFRDFAASNLTGAQGLKGKSWPDLDMLPFGWLTNPDAHEGPHRSTKLTQDEQRTQFPHIVTLDCNRKKWFV